MAITINEQQHGIPNDHTAVPNPMPVDFLFRQNVSCSSQCAAAVFCLAVGFEVSFAVSCSVLCVARGQVHISTAV